MLREGDGGETFLAFLTTAARDIARRKQGDCAEDWRALDLKPISRSKLWCSCMKHVGLNNPETPRV